MTDPLHRLLEIQEQDTAGDQLRHRREHHPVRSELDELSARLTELRGREGEARAERDAIRARQSELESEVSSTNDRLAGIDQRMYSGEVSAARDLQAMSGEADALRARISRLEDLVLEAMEEAEPVEAVLAGLEGEVAATEARQVQAGVELEEAETGIRAEEAEHAEARQALLEGVPTELLDRYEKLRSRLGGVAVAPLHNGACGGCHLSLPATELERIRKAPAEAVTTCEQCGRILVRP